MGGNTGTGKPEKELVKELKKMSEEKAGKGSNSTNLLLDSKWPEATWVSISNGNLKGKNII